jgi:hypothetical protein
LFVGAVGLVGELLDKIFDGRDFDTDVFYIFPIMLLDGRARGFSDTVIRSLPPLGATGSLSPARSCCFRAARFRSATAATAQDCFAGSMGDATSQPSGRRLRLPHPRSRIAGR